MPKKIEKKLDAEIRKKGLTGKAADAYKYGTLAKIEKTMRKSTKHK